MVVLAPRISLQGFRGVAVVWDERSEPRLESTRVSSPPPPPPPPIVKCPQAPLSTPPPPPARLPPPRPPPSPHNYKSTQGQHDVVLRGSQAEAQCGCGS